MRIFAQKETKTLEIILSPRMCNFLENGLELKWIAGTLFAKFHLDILFALENANSLTEGSFCKVVIVKNADEWDDFLYGNHHMLNKTYLKHALSFIPILKVSDKVLSDKEFWGEVITYLSLKGSHSDVELTNFFIAETAPLYSETIFS